MICPKCGAYAADGRTSCVNCGEPLKTDSFSEEDLSETYDPTPGGTGSGTWDGKPVTREVYKGGKFGFVQDSWGKWMIFGMAMLSALFGIAGTLVIWYIWPYAVFAWAPIFSIGVLLPISGGIAQIMGFHKLGGVMLIVAGIPLVLTVVGVICIIAGTKALKNGGLADEARAKDQSNIGKYSGEIKIRTGIVEKVLLIVFVVIILTIPTVTVVVRTAEPLPYVKTVQLPDSYQGSFGGSGDLDITVTLGNAGREVAKSEKITISITTSAGLTKFNWEGYDVEPGGEATKTFPVPMSGSFMANSVDNVLVSYGGQRMHLKFVNQEYSSSGF